MNYGRLIGRAWHLTWQHRFLWLLGLFATSSVGSCSVSGSAGTGFQWQVGPSELGPASPDAERLLRGAGLWASQNVQTILLAVAALLLLGAVFVAVSLVAQGGMARATTDLALGRPIGAREAWSAGVGLFWRYLGLWLVALGVAVVLILVVGGFLAGAYPLSQAVAGPTRSVVLLLEGLLAVLLVALAVPTLVGFSIALAFAQRAIAVENAGPLSALATGFRLLRDRPGESLLVWLINLALGIVTGMVVAVAAIALLLMLLGLGVVVWTIVDLLAAMLLYALAALITWIAAAWFLAAVANSFFWNYWTLAYLRLTGRLDDQLEGRRE